MQKDNQSNTEEEIFNDNIEDQSLNNNEQKVNISISNCSSGSKK